MNRRSTFTPFWGIVAWLAMILAEIVCAAFEVVTLIKTRLYP